MSKSNPSFEPVPKSTEPFAFSVAEVAELSGLSRASIYLALESEALSGKKSGRRTLILTEDVRNFLQNLPDYSPRSRDGGS